MSLSSGALIRTNPQTGGSEYSFDGGMTWYPVMPGGRGIATPTGLSSGTYMRSTTVWPPGPCMELIELQFKGGHVEEMIIDTNKQRLSTMLIEAQSSGWLTVTDGVTTLSFPAGAIKAIRLTRITPKE